MQFPEPRKVAAEVVEVEVLSPRVHGLTLRSLGPDPLRWVPGQYVELSLPADDRRTPYSIACAPEPSAPGRLELAVARGSSAGLFDELAVGDRVELLGPKGRFVRREHAPAAEVFIGTGTGLAPLRAMLQQSLRSGNRAPALILFGVRTEPEILWRSELEILTHQNPRIRFEPTLSQAGAGWKGRRGRVQDHLDELLAPYANAHVYVCGVPEMVVDCVSELTGPLGFPSDRVMTESH